MSAPLLTQALRAAGFRTLRAWAEAANVPAQRIYQFRHDRKHLSEAHVRALAGVVGLPASLVRSLLVADVRGGHEP